MGNVALQVATKSNYMISYATYAFLTRGRPINKVFIGPIFHLFMPLCPIWTWLSVPQSRHPKTFTFESFSFFQTQHNN